MQSLRTAPPFFISSPHCVLMSAAQAFAAVEAAKAEWVISRAALSAAMQVKVLVTDVLPLQCARRRSLQKRRPFRGRMYLEHDADRVNDFLVSVGVARTQIWPVQFCARACDFRELSSFFCNSNASPRARLDRSATAKPTSRLASAAPG